MSYADGWAAINLEMPPRVPRTEFSAWRYWDLIRVVTGVNAEPDSPPEVRQQASNAFMKAWNFDLRWATLISSDDLAECRTDTWGTRSTTPAAPTAETRALARSKRPKRCSRSTRGRAMGGGIRRS